MTEQPGRPPGGRPRVRGGGPPDVDERGGVIEFSAEVWHWRGPAPYVFVTVPERHVGHLRAVSKAVTYGWGMIPVLARIGGTEWETSLFPKDGGYVVPLKHAVRRAERVDEGDTVTVRLIVADPR